MRTKKRSLAVKILQFYVFLWPTLRTYFTYIKMMGHKKRPKKEKVIIMEE